MTRKAIAMLAVLALSACSKDEKPGTTTTTGASNKEQAASVEDVRMGMLSERPDATLTINALEITSADGVVTLRGHVEDEQMRKALVDRVKRTSGVKEVKDELMVMPTRIKLETGPAAGQGDQAGTPSGSPTATPMQTRRTEAIRTELGKDPKSSAVLDRIIVTDDGSAIVVAGTVPDQATRDAVLKQAKKAADVTNVKDEIIIAK